MLETEPAGDFNTAAEIPADDTLPATPADDEMIKFILAWECLRQKQAEAAKDQDGKPQDYLFL